MFAGGVEEEFHRFIQRGARLDRGRSGTGDIQGHGVGNELGAFAPDLHGVVNFHGRRLGE